MAGTWWWARCWKAFSRLADDAVARDCRSTREKEHSMDAQDAVDLGRQAIVVTLLIGSPVLLAGMVVGLIIGLLQAVTQIQEQTIAFVPKLVVMVLAIALLAPWLINQMVQYSHDLLASIPSKL